LSKPAARASPNAARAPGAVQAREPKQFVVAKRLHAEAETVDARAAIRREPRLGHRLGIRLERDLAVGREVERRLAGRDDPRDLLGLEQRGCPAPEEDRIGARPS